MITGRAPIKDMYVLTNVLESEILELGFALDDVQTGDEIDENYMTALQTEKDILEKLLKRIRAGEKLK